MSTIDQQFVEYVVKSLVSKPEAVEVSRTIDEKGVLLVLTVDPEDLGRVIGKKGATAQSLRTLLRALGTKNDARYNLRINDNGPARENRPNYQAPTSSKPEEATEQVAPQPESEFETSLADSDESTTSSKDKYSKTRQELEDLDDLDI